MNDTVVIYIQAYNAERTLRRTLESVLQQTYSNWIVFLVDNGSIDETKKIADDYAGKNPRIICKHVFPNDIWYFYSFIEEYVKRPLGNYFTWLDADDEYKPKFLQETMSSIKKDNLGICVCGSDYIDASNGKILLTKSPEKNFIIDSDGFSKQFLEYRRFTDTIWGKVYSFSVLKAVEYKQIPRIQFAPDSVIVLELFKKCYQTGMRIGFLQQSLHRYYQAQNTLSQQFPVDFVSDIHIYYAALVKYLKCFGQISKLNMDYLYAIWLGWIQDYFIRICNEDIPISQKLEAVNSIFSSPVTSAMLKRKADCRFQNLAARKEFCQSVRNWLCPYLNDERYGSVAQKIIAELKVN